MQWIQTREICIVQIENLLIWAMITSTHEAKICFTLIYFTFLMLAILLTAGHFLLLTIPTVCHTINLQFSLLAIILDNSVIQTFSWQYELIDV